MAVTPARPPPVGPSPDVRLLALAMHESLGRGGRPARTPSRVVDRLAARTGVIDMQIREIGHDDDFSVVMQNERAQAAVMALGAGESTGGPDNRHTDADQWLFVVEGEGTAIVDGESHPLRAGTLLLIERGETHEIRSAGGGTLRTLNVYVPPEY